ncbi:hypothetical protein ACUOFU_14530 [Microbacterium arabinogalactanolyticum]|uniref:hypothetical protein n=1 Tax=Microbacterium arabinogalactanolyticum TaxID=69365 RepID=UPI004043CC4B
MAELHPGKQPPQTLVREWDQQAWALDRPQKAHDAGRAEDRWMSELHDVGFGLRASPEVGEWHLFPR